MERAREQERGFEPRPYILDLIGSGGLPEEARELAHRLVRRARKEGGRHEPEVAAPPAEVRAKREARRRREPSP